MRNTGYRWRAVLLALPVAAALGFGAGQALASPSAGGGGTGRECVPDRRCWAACPFAGGNVTFVGDCICCEY